MVSQWDILNTNFYKFRDSFKTIILQERHQNQDLYFSEQVRTTVQYVIPYLSSIRRVSSDSKILEIGCGHGGNMKPFLELGCSVSGIDLNSLHIKIAKKKLNQWEQNGQLCLIESDIYKLNKETVGQFDWVIMRDVIEHIFDQQKFLTHLKQFLNTNAHIFFAFPPWYMPFGGHQQICRSRILSALPYFHLLPRPFYCKLLKWFKEPSVVIQELNDIKNTGLSIEHWEHLLKKQGYCIIKKTLFLINPHYQTKFGLKPRKCLAPFSKFCFLRNFFVTSCYYVIQINKSKVL